MSALETVGETKDMPGTNGGFTMAIFAASDVPSETPLTPLAPAQAEIERLARDYSELRASYDAVAAKLAIERAHGTEQTARALSAEERVRVLSDLLGETVEAMTEAHGVLTALGAEETATLIEPFLTALAAHQSKEQTDDQ